jgi:hypothetical protein
MCEFDARAAAQVEPQNASLPVEGRQVFRACQSSRFAAFYAGVNPHGP